MPRQTTFIKPGSNRLTWRHVDASGKVLGRLATQVATVLMGKHRPDYTPNVDCGEAVVVTNAGAVELTGRKADQKTLRKWSGYAGGLRVRTNRTLQKEDPCTMVEEAIIRMLPRGPLGNKMRRRLKIFAGAEHPHTAQQPKALEVKSRRTTR
ncbi:MAG: 50S ribosomal protein L13 [Planctomycetota bacterium]